MNENKKLPDYTAALDELYQQEGPPDETPIELYVAWTKEDSGKVRKIRLQNGKYITLNQQQNEALDLAELWIKDRTSLFFTLSGYAGTGKSTIAKEIIKEFGNKSGFGQYAVVATAPTHPAKKVIGQFTGLEAETLQSLLGLMPHVELADFDVNKPEFAQKKKPSIEYYKLVILDEGSMVNKPLWEMLKVQARRFNVKILVMGDAGQLNPVKEDDISVIFTDKDITYKYQLTMVERQADGNPLMVLYDSIRNNVNTAADQFDKVDNVVIMMRPDQQGSNDPRNPQIETGYRFMHTVNQFGQAIMQAYKSDEYHLDKSHCKVLCWSNAQVEFWNASIRRTLISELSRKPKISQETLLHANVLIPNELLMGYATYKDGIMNAGEYEVISMQYDQKKVWYGDKKQYWAELRGYRVALRDIDEDTIVNVFIVEPESENITAFTKVFNNYLFLAKTTRAWPAYYAFKLENLLIKSVYDNQKQLIIKKDLEYAYAITTHKAQGRTLDQVFVDLHNINQNDRIPERNRLKYVALSRPRYLATIFTGGTS